MPTGEASPTGDHRLLVGWAHLAVLWAFAFAQPLLDVLGDAPEFFVARGNTRGDILLLAFALVLLPPTVMALLELALQPARRVQLGVHLALVALFTAAIALHVVKEVAPGADATVSIGLAIALGALGGLLYARRPGVRTFLTVLSPAPLVFLGLFLLVSPASKLVLPQGEVSASGAGGLGAPVVMVVFDEFSGASLLDRRGAIDASRYPHLAELARGSTWYRNATTVDYATERAVPALLTGTQPAGDSLPIAADHPRSLFTLLGGSYDLHVQEPATELCPESLCGERDRKESGERLRSLVDDLSVVSLHLLLPSGLEDDLPAVDNTFEGFGGSAGRAAPSGRTLSGIPASAFENRTGQFTRFLHGIEAGQRDPTLDFLHVGLPHWPWQYLPSGRQYASNIDRIPGIEGSAWVRDPALAEQGYQRYLLQLGYVDRLVGRLIARLRGEGLYDRALLVVTADHGVSFRPGRPRRVATRANFPDIASVPLFIREPGQRRGRIDDSPVRTFDVLPTIADVLGLEPGWRFDGRSARHGISGRETAAVLSGALIEMDFAGFERRRDAEVSRKTELFGSGDGGAGLFAAGGGSGLLGVRPGGLVRPASDRLRAEIDDLPLLDDVDRRSGLVPAFVRGRLVGTIDPGTRIAVALNGTIRAVAPVYRDRGDIRFGAMLPPAAFRRGRNAVSLFTVSDGPGSSGLTTIAQAGETEAEPGRLTGGRKATRIELGGGHAVRVTPGATTGYVEKVTAQDPAHLTVIGWAADPHMRRHVERVLVFADGRLIASVRPTVARVDVVARLGRPALYSGYRFVSVLRGADAVAEDPSRLRAFAVLGGRASELKLLPAAGD